MRFQTTLRLPAPGLLFLHRYHLRASACPEPPSTAVYPVVTKMSNELLVTVIGPFTRLGPSHRIGRHGEIR